MATASPSSSVVKAITSLLGSSSGDGDDGGDVVEPASVQRCLNRLVAKEVPPPVSEEDGERIVKNMKAYMDNWGITMTRSSSSSKSSALSIDDFQAISDQYINKTPSSNSYSNSDSRNGFSKEELELFKLCLAHFNGNVQEMFVSLNSSLTLTAEEMSNIAKCIGN